MKELRASHQPHAVWRSLGLILVPTLVLLGIEVYNTAVAVPEVRRTQQLITHSLEVLVAARALDQAVQDAERGQRGFIITGDSGYLAAYRTGIVEIPPALAAMQRLVVDEPEQQERLLQLEGQIDIKLDELKRSFEARQTTGFDAARAIVATNVGFEAMNKVTSLISAAIATENSQLAERQAFLRDTQRIGTNVRVAATVLAFFVTMLGGVLLSRSTLRTIRSQAAMQESEERFRMLLSGVRDYAIFMLDPQGRVITWNEGAERIKGYRQEEILGSHYSRFYPPEEVRAGLPDRLLKIASADGRTEVVAWRIRKDGSRFWANVLITALRDERGNLRGFVKVTRDMTEQRQQQEALEQNRAALAQAQKMEAVGQLTGGVAHDFNNLLTTILGSVDLLIRLPGQMKSERASALLGAIARAAEHGATLTQRLLAFSRQQPLAPQIVDINKLVGSMSELLHRTLGENIDMETVLAAGLWSTKVDRNQLESALLNLAVNARDAMQEGGKLTIETGNTFLDDDYAATHAEVTPGQYVMLAVSDTGTGMSQDTIVQAFDPFFTTKPEGKGTGLGLSQVHGFIKQSGGHIKLYSEPRHGTTVKIYLPRQNVTREVEPRSEWSKAARAMGETVLLVEDDDLVRAYSKDALEFLGYRAIDVADATTALRVLGERSDIVLLFTDIGLPGMNGRQLAAEAQRRNPRVKILYTTGYTRNAVVHHGILDAGVNLLPKPFTVETLGRKVQEILRGGG
jgi:PAS domain S-box-containing protein